MSGSEGLENVCMGCGHRIIDRYLLCIDGEMWHERCVVCTVCFRPLEHSCHIREGKLFCKYDYFRQFGICCLNCGHPIFPHEPMLRLEKLSESRVDEYTEQDRHPWTGAQIHTRSTLIANNLTDPQHHSSIIRDALYFHDSCFTCLKCHRLLCPGEAYILRDSQPVCYLDYQRELMELDQQSRIPSIPIILSGDEPDYLDPVGSGTKFTKMIDSVHTSVESMLIVHKTRDDSDHCEHVSVVTDYQCGSRPASSDGSSRGAPDRPDEEEEMFEMDSDSGSGKNSKRPRTILTASQRRRFKSVFEMNPKPARKMREALATETGLNIRVVQVWFQNQRAKMKKLARRQAQEVLQQAGRRLYACGNRISESRPTGHITSQGMNAEPPVGQMSPAGRNESAISLYNFNLVDLEDRAFVGPPVAEIPAVKSEDSWPGSGGGVPENSRIAFDSSVLPTTKESKVLELSTTPPPLVNFNSSDPQSPSTLLQFPPGSGMQNTSTTNAELVNSNSINCTQPMTVRLLPGVPLLAGPFYTNPLFPCFEQMRHASPNVSVADLLLPTPPSGPPPPPPPAMDKLFSMQQSYFLS